MENMFELDVQVSKSQPSASMNQAGGTFLGSSICSWNTIGGCTEYDAM
ncbi:FDLD family class I lanthipeptide [Tumebacillus flagellatus]|nr:FDLD family class I lanthipeptide [Tumebacillus flagellatus]